MKCLRSVLLFNTLTLSLGYTAKWQDNTIDTSDNMIYPLSSDSDFNFQLLEALSFAPYEGSDISEMLVAANQIAPGDFEGFYKTFDSLANRANGQDQSINASRFPVSARNTFFKAATYFRFANFYLHSNWSDAKIIIKSLQSPSPSPSDNPDKQCCPIVYTVRTLAQYQQDLANRGIVRPKGIETFMEKYNGMKDTCPDFVDDNQVVNWLMLNVLAGGDSTAGAMRSVIYHLGRNPSKYQKLVDELKAARLPLPAQWKDFRQLSYLDAAINETLRRDVPEGGFRLPDGRFVPAGSKIGIYPAVVTRDTGVFGPNVHDYDPDRWLQRDGEADEDYKVRRRRMQETIDFMFGAGNRVYIQVKDPNREWESRSAWFMYQRDIQMRD
ncbi:cytochrome P450 [Phialemonium atrogriseum]|uniref:Cytochrome P450 n=1 Tax=Phialemonium atrogriseum TaxID=1093897 RepID=A0AAJ0FFR9_9PEZI|nr:cytochrome P450 [Phialemonium atrogriseum]KAK1761668.1 cytochrome P450 [Phialemonium atrogriseum]